MLAFLGENGAKEWDQRALITAIGGEDGLSFGQSSENDVGEGLGEGYRLYEVGDWELILTGFDGGFVCACENAVYAYCM